MCRRAVRAFAALALLLSFAAGAACPESKDSEALFNAAHRAQAEGALAEAIDCQQRGLALLGDTLKAAQEQQVLAKQMEQSGKIPESVAVLKLALPNMQRLSGPTTEATGDLLRQLGWVEYMAGALPDAEAHLRRAQAVYTSRLGARHIKVAKALNNLGVVQRDRGEYEEAENIFASAQQIATTGLTPDDDMVAVILNNLAGLWYYRGDYRRAVESYKKALPIFERLYGEYNTDVGMNVNNLGAMYEELGDYQSASAYYARALAIQEKLLGPTHLNVAAPVNNLAVVAHALGDVRRAEHLFMRALRIYEASVGKDHPAVAEVLVKYAALKRQLGQDEAARSDLERALKIQEASFGPDNIWIAATLNELGPVYQSLHQYPRANDALVRAIDAAAAGDEPQTLLIAYGHYADLLAAGGESVAAVFYGKCAVNLAQEIRNNVSALGRAVQKSFLSKRQHLYRDLADRLIAAGRLAEAEQVMTMLKEEEFFDFVRVALRTEDGGATRADFSAIERPYADELRGSLSRLATAARNFRAPADDSSEKAARRSALSGEQGALRAMLGSITRALAHKSPSRRPSKSAPHGREDIAPAAARVRYLVTEQRVRMIVATSTETIDQQVNVDLSRLNRLVFEFRQALQTPKQNPLTIANTLHRLLIEPLQAVLARNNVVSLEFEPDGVLRYLPFSALYDGESYLIERFDIKQRTPVNSGQRALATSAQRLAGFGVSKAMAGFPALPSVGAELDRIVRRGPDDREGVMPGILVMDEAFTELSLRSALAKDYSLVHIASHFAFRPGPLSDSHLLLGDGKLLTLERLRDGGISLANVRLLTLSACSTAMGEAAANGGELESFGVLAQRLGAREVLASLWPVADRSTSMLMLNMYRGLGHSKTSTARALRRAQLNLLRGERHFAPYAHPFYWAPFILMSSAPDRKVQAP